MAQSISIDEIVVSDDGSDDGTLEHVEGLLASARRQGTHAVVTRNPGPRGVVDNFSHGLQVIRSDLIALSDQDDAWRPDKLERMRSLFIGRPELLLAHSDARLVDAGGVSTGETLFDALGVGRRELRGIHAGRAIDTLFRRNVVTGATTMLRRELVTRALPVPEGWLHDEWLAMAGAALGGVDVIEEPLIDYRQHGDNEIGAQVLSLAGRARRMAEPRSRRNARLLVRASALPDALRRIEAPEEIVAKAERKRAHERRRSALPAARVARLPGVAAGVLRGDYRRFGRGILDAARDTIQPA